MSDGEAEKSVCATFDEFSEVRSAAALAASGDVEAEEDARRRVLERAVHQLVFEINLLQLRFAADQRDYLTERERLTLDLARLKLCEAVKWEQARSAHHLRLTRLRAGHSQSLVSLAAAAPAPRLGRMRALDGARQPLREPEHSLDDTGGGAGPPPDWRGPLAARLRDLVRERAAMLRESRQTKRTRVGHLVELIWAVDAQSADGQEQIAEFQKRSAENEAKWRDAVAGVTVEITKVLERRAKAGEQRKQ
jgi:hypothetical protein